MFKKKQREFLFITENENKVLICVRKKSKTIFVIHKETNIPRSNLYVIIKKLYIRGLIQVVTIGRRYTYKTTDSKTIKQTLLAIASGM